jgi:hypothetical protein
MSDTLAQLERKVNVMQVVRDHPWPSIALAAGAGFLLAGSKVDVKAAAATVKATGGASSKLGTALDDVAARLITGVSEAVQGRVDGWVNELRAAIGAPRDGDSRSGGSREHLVADLQLGGSQLGARQGSGASMVGTDRGRSTSSEL